MRNSVAKLYGVQPAAEDTAIVGVMLRFSVADGVGLGDKGVGDTVVKVDATGMSDCEMLEMVETVGVDLFKTLDAMRYVPPPPSSTIKITTTIGINNVWTNERLGILSLSLSITDSLEAPGNAISSAGFPLTKFSCGKFSSILSAYENCV